MPIKKYYRELLKLYARTILNTKRASENTFRTLPSVWNINYWNIILGALKIGQQFYNGHRHHSEKELRLSRYKGIELKNYSFKKKLEHPSFMDFDKKEVKNTISKDQIIEVVS